MSATRSASRPSTVPGHSPAVADALAVLGRQTMILGGAWSELERADLRGAELDGLNIPRVCLRISTWKVPASSVRSWPTPPCPTPVLRGTDLSHADLRDTDLTRADLDAPGDRPAGQRGAASQRCGPESVCL
jgi:hypothetical protein